MNIAFCTCVKFGKSCIDTLKKKQINIKLLITLKDNIGKKKVGRIYLKKDKNQILLKIKHINDKIVIEKIKKYKIDYLFIIGWSQIANQNVIRAVKKKVIGAHPTLLPRGKGRAPIPWTILKQLKNSGLSFFLINKKIDSGPIIHQEKFHVEENENATTLFSKVNKYHAIGIQKVMEMLKKNNIKYLPTKNKIETFWKKRTPKDGLIKKSFFVKKVDLYVRALTTPYPCAFFKNKDGSVIKVFSGSIGRKKNGITVKFKDGYYTFLKYKRLKVIY